MDDIKMWTQWSSFKNVSFTKRSMTPNNPKVTFDPISVKDTCATLPKDYSIHTSKYVDTVIIKKKKKNTTYQVPGTGIHVHTQ